MSESKIRDSLANNLSMIDSTYRLVDKEHYLRNEQGSRGFIDILATNTENQHIIIEVKRANTSSREAIHEILKYIEGIKVNKGANDDEIIAVIVSTEWKELLVPFSSFVKRVNFTVIGYHIEVTKDFNLISATQVSPLMLTNDRIISDCHMAYRYLNKKRMLDGVQSISSCYEKKGVFDYLIVVLTPPEGEGDREREAVKATIKNLGLTNKDLHNFIPDYEYMLYSTSMLMSDQEYLSIISEDSDLTEEFDADSLEGLERTDRTNYLYGYTVLDRLPFPKSDHTELGTPSKFSQVFLEGGWKIQQILRFGKLEANTFLSDDVLIDELKGLTGTNHSLYKKNISSKSISSFEQIRSDITNCLQDNPIWLSGINQALTTITKELHGCDFEGEIYIYHPSNTLSTIFNIISNPDSYESWIPRYHVSVKSDTRTLHFYGCLDRNQEDIAFEDVLVKFYNSDPRQLMLTQIWGGYEPSDYQIAPSYGLQYTNFRVDLRPDGLKHSFKFDGFSYQISQNIHPYQGLMTFIEEKRTFCHDVFNFYASRQLGGILLLDSVAD
ncbi:endonuclease NucS domain-containing protein [Vibrio campbellii]|uniref:endonuclease NucS domain-containing protein n=1 Tax=Vibrio campbellii TaxID=680 RepID=UPI003AAED448